MKKRLIGFIEDGKVLPMMGETPEQFKQNEKTLLQYAREKNLISEESHQENRYSNDG